MTGLLNHANAMIFRVADVDRAGRSHENSVWPGKFAFERRAFLVVTSLARPGNRDNHAVYHIDHSNGVVFRIRYIDVSVRRYRDAFWTIESALLRRAAVAGESFLSRSGCVMNHAAGEIQLQHSVALPQCEPQVPVRVESQRAWSTERCAGDGCTVRSRLPFARARIRRDGVALHVH